MIILSIDFTTSILKYPKPYQALVNKTQWEKEKKKKAQKDLNTNYQTINKLSTLKENRKDGCD